MASSYSKGFLKVIVIGDSGVGKTSLLEAFNYKKVSKSSKPTIGAEFTKKKVKLDNG
jgi:Ras-related protein Rab-7A